MTQRLESTATRAWQALVDKLSKMDVEAIQGQDHVFRFSKVGLSSVILRIKKEPYGCCCTDGLYKIVELLDESGNVLAKEKLFENYSIYAKNEKHPLDDLFEFVKKGETTNTTKLQEIRAIQKLSES